MLAPAEGETRAASAMRSELAGGVPPRRAVLGRAERGGCGWPCRGTGRTWRRLLLRYRCPGPAGARGAAARGSPPPEQERVGGAGAALCPGSVSANGLLSIWMGCGETERCPQRWPPD